MNLGLRYELQGPWSERYNRLTLWNLNATSPLAAAANLPGITGEVCLVASPCDPSRNNWNLQKHLFAPRLGIAYQITPNTVARGGYGIFYIPINVYWNESPNNDFDDTTTTPYVASINGGVTPYQTWTTAFQNGVPLPPGRASNINLLAEEAGAPSSDTVLNQPVGYMEQYNLDIQRQLPKGFFLDVAYAGSRGIHLQYGSQATNQLPDSDLAMGSNLNNSVPNPFYGVIPAAPFRFPRQRRNSSSSRDLNSQV